MSENTRKTSDQQIQNTKTSTSTHQESLREFFDELQTHGIASANNLHRTIGEGIKQRTAILQDIANVSLAILGGMITLAIFAQGRIKTGLLFYFAGAGFVVCIVSAFLIRMMLLRIWDKILWLLRERENSIRQAVGQAKYHGSQDHHEAMREFENVLGEDIEEPRLPWLVHVYTISAITVLFILSLVLVGISLLFKITAY